MKNNGPGGGAIGDLARAIGLVQLRYDVARELIGILDEILYGDHLRCYNDFLGDEEDDNETESTYELEKRAHDILTRARSLFTSTQDEMNYADFIASLGADREG